jgi:hypothetical protein
VKNEYTLWAVATVGWRGVQARIRATMGPVNRCLAMLGTLLMCIVPVWAQVGTVHVSVTGPDGSGISQATVSTKGLLGSNRGHCLH